MLVKRTIRQIIVLAGVLVLVCVLCLPGAALARGVSADAAGSQGGSLEKVSVNAQAVPADPVAEKALASAKASLENQTGVTGIAPGDSADATWIRRNPANSPAGRFEYGMVYDSQNHKVILFGGIGRNAFLNDTWVYDYAANAWTNRSPAGSPAARREHAMTYDSQNGKAILFGGRDVSSSFNDTWEYNYAGNTCLLYTSPSPRDS